MCINVRTNKNKSKKYLQYKYKIVTLHFESRKH